MKRIIMGNYGAGDGVFGIKCSLSGYDVSVRADDQNVTRRSFNSEWTSLCKIKIIGVVQSEWSQYQYQGEGQYIPNSVHYWSYSVSGWQQVTPVIIPHGFSYIPIWEERVYIPSSSTIYDDYLFPSSQSTNETSFSGARSWHSGPTTNPQASLFFAPYSGVPGFDPVINQNSIFYDIDPGSGNPYFPGYPAYPAYPTKPTNKPAQIYVIYNNSLGTMV